MSEIVIGHSLNRDGGANRIHAQVESLVTDLTLQLGFANSPTARTVHYSAGN